MISNKNISNIFIYLSSIIAIIYAFIIFLGFNSLSAYFAYFGILQESQVSIQQYLLAGIEPFKTIVVSFIFAFLIYYPSFLKNYNALLTRLLLVPQIAIILLFALYTAPPSLFAWIILFIIVHFPFLDLIFYTLFFFWIFLTLNKLISNEQPADHIKLIILAIIVASLFFSSSIIFRVKGQLIAERLVDPIYLGVLPQVSIYLNNAQNIEGRLIYYNGSCFYVKTENKQFLTIPSHNIKTINRLSPIVDVGPFVTKELLNIINK